MGHPPEGPRPPPEEKRVSGRTKLNVDGERLAGITAGPLPASRKGYLPGTMHPDVRAPFREISLHPTRVRRGEGWIETPNAPLRVYDPSGPYTDPAVTIDLSQGLPGVRPWLDRAPELETLPHVSSAYGRAREADPRLQALRMSTPRRPRVARPGHNVTQLHAARKGIVTPEMEAVALRENLGAEQAEAAHHAGQAFGARLPGRVTPEFVRDEVARGRMVIPANVVHLSRAGADGHRHQGQVQDQRQHRQLGGHLRHRERAGQARDGRRPGRRHGDGPLHRRQHRRDPPRDHRRQPGADRHRADLPGDPAGQGKSRTSPSRTCSTWSSTRPSRGSTT